MKKIILAVFLIFLTFASLAASGVSSTQCKEDALNDAKKLLSFYRENDERIQIDDTVTPLAKIKNPANKNQSFDVLEVWGYIYKGQYRMRLIYASDLNCLLMGEEILENASL